MDIKKQFGKIKDNWLIVLILVLLALFLNGGAAPLFDSASRGISGGSFMQEMAVSSYQKSIGIMPPLAQDFAPDAADRKITKSASVSVEVKQGTFRDAESKLKSIVKSSNSYLLNENVNTYDSGWKSYYNGYYTVKVDSRKYNDIVTQLKGIGEVKSFNENADDITGSYTNAKIELEAEKERLARFQQMYGEATKVEDKIQLNDRLFDQERRVKYLEDSLKDINRQVDYSTISISISEKQSEYANIALIKFSELVRRLVSSINGLFALIVMVLPYAVAAAVVWIGVRIFRRKK